MAEGVSFEHLDILNLTPEEKRFYKQIFNQADTDSSGVVTGEVAVKFLEKTGVPSHVLGEIWQIADQENRGFLTPAGFAVCLRLIAQYQGGKDPDAKLAFQPGPLPKFEGVHTAPPPNIQPQLSGTGPIRVPPLSPEKATDYAGLFDRSGTQDGVMAGDKAKEIFEKARLPNEILGRIWNLADTEERGALSVTEFIIAMHLLASYRSRTMAGIPATLPAGLWEAAARRVQPGQAQGGPLPRQLSGASGPIRTGSPATRAQFSPPGASPVGGSNWVVTPELKQQWDVLFSRVDGARTGFINGDQAVAFFSESGLNEDFLAQIWDLSDINSEGKLNRDEFALAMYLIRLQRGKTQSVLPSTLPPNFIPPSMRGQARPPAQSTAPAFDTAATPVAARSATEDLFGLDVLTPSQPTSQVPQSTGGSAVPQRSGADPFGSQPSSPKVAQAPAGASSFKPFIPSSTFGRGLQHQNTGTSTGSAGSGSRGLQQQSAMDDLLGDNDPEVSRKLTSETAELANMSNQIGTLRTQMQEVQQKKTVSETDLDRTSKQKRDLELRLSQFRQQYENEIRAVKELEQKLTTSKADTEKLRRDHSTIEASFRDLQGQHQQLAQALAADQQENANLKQRISETNTGISQLKPQLEKLRADARLEKGRVAINKKQLATNESEREKAETEIRDLKREAEENARASPTPPAASVISPAISTASQSTNPFFRRSPQQSFDQTMSPAALAREAPAASTQQPKSTQEDFDNFFNTTGFSSSQNSGPPLTTFRSEPIESPIAVATPPVSTPFQESVQPPAPPESRQITSKELPLQPPAERAESFSSSVRVQTPVSRIGPSGAATPTPGPRLDAKEAFQKAAIDRAATSTPPMASGIPGAFPEPSPSVQRTGTADGKADFDSAFAGFPYSGPASEKDFPGPSVNGTVAKDANPSTLNQEFPPIRDVEPDDEDSSDDDGGFDDNFGSPGQNRRGEAQAQPAFETPAGEASHEDDLYAPRPQVQQASSFVSDLPTPNAQKSPPTYGETMSDQNVHSPTAFPPEFGGLLPSRDDPTGGVEQPEQEAPVTISHDHLSEDQLGGPVGGSGSQERSLFGDDSTSTPRAPSQGGLHDSSSTTASDAFHSVASFSSNQNFDAHTGANGKPAAVDDFDSGFDDLDQAKEHDLDEADDSFVAANQHQEGFDDFNPTFDTPAASKANTLASANPTPSGSRVIMNAPQVSSFGDFEDEIEGAFGGSKAATTKPAAAPPGATDWDDIFSNLDKDSTGLKPGATGAFPSVNNGGPATTTVVDDDFDVPPPPGPPPSKSRAAGMPKLGRAISTGTEHDDPILKRLTAKGFSRDDAVSALEKYDYDSDKALEHLSQPYLAQLTGMGYKKEDAVRALKAYDYDLSKAANYLTSST